MYALFVGKFFKDLAPETCLADPSIDKESSKLIQRNTKYLYLYSIVIGSQKIKSGNKRTFQSLVQVLVSVSVYLTKWAGLRFVTNTRGWQAASESVYCLFSCANILALRRSRHTGGRQSVNKSIGQPFSRVEPYMLMNRARVLQCINWRESWLSSFWNNTCRTFWIDRYRDEGFIFSYPKNM